MVITDDVRKCRRTTAQIGPHIATLMHIRRVRFVGKLSVFERLIEDCCIGGMREYHDQHNFAMAQQHV